MGLTTRLGRWACLDHQACLGRWARSGRWSRPSCRVRLARRARSDH